MNELHLFAGAGGGILGGMLLGHTCVCAVENNRFCQQVLLQRQRDEILPWFPIWDDIKTFDAVPWRGCVDVVCSGFPCQKHSDIGKLHGSKGFDGWPDSLRVIGEIYPNLVWLENVPAILAGDFWRVIGDLAILGYDAKWGVFSACSVGAPHTRERLFILAYPSGVGLPKGQYGLAECKETRQSTLSASANRATWISRLGQPTIPDKPDELADYLGELKAIGNGQVPSVVRLAWQTLTQ